MKKFLVSNWKTVLLLIFLICFISFSLLSISNESLTFDEIVYLQEGREIILNHTFSVDPYNPPFIKEISILPYLSLKKFHNDSVFMLHYPYLAKLVVVVFGLGILLLTYFLTKNLFGENEALFAVFLLSFEPTFIANSNLVTLDIGLTFFFLLSYSLFLNLLEHNPNLRQKIYLILGIGLGIATKLSFIPFFLVSIFFVSFYKFRNGFLKKILVNKLQIVAMIFTSLIVVWGIYFFTLSPIIKQRNDTTRVSQKILTFASKHHLPFVSYLISFGENKEVPLGDFIAINKNTLLRKPVSNCFFLGNYYNSCFWYFLPLNLFLKLPLSIIILFSVSIFLLTEDKSLRRAKIFIIIPIICMLVISSLSRMQPLVRYLLPAIPLIIIFTSSSLAYWQKTLIKKVFLIVLCFWYIISVISAFPNFLSYANEDLGSSHNRFLYLTDSNLDWGQSLPAAERFIKANKSDKVLFSYFGRDNGDWYGLKSDKQYGSYKTSEICEFHVIKNTGQNDVILISSSNWYICGYFREKRFAKNKIKGILGNTILEF